MGTDTKRKTYSEKLKDPRWQKKRLEIFERDDWFCRKCGDTDSTLHLHHIEYQNCDPWDCDKSKLITLCEVCHKIIERIKKDEHLTVPTFKDILIYKLTGWTDNSKTIFISTINICTLEIYDKDNNWINGYHFKTWELKEIMKIFRKSINLNKSKDDKYTF